MEEKIPKASMRKEHIKTLKKSRQIQEGGIESLTFIKKYVIIIIYKYKKLAAPRL